MPGDCVRGRGQPAFVDGDQFNLCLGLSRLGQHGQGLGGIGGDLRDFGIFRMHRRDVMVFGHRTEPRHAQFQNHRIVDGKLHGLTDLLIGEWRHLRVHSRDHRCGCDSRFPHQACRIICIREVGAGFVIHVDLASREGGEEGRLVGSHVDELDPVQIGLAPPPGAILAPFDDGTHAHLERDKLERPGADGGGRQIAAVREGGMHT